MKLKYILNLAFAGPILITAAHAGQSVGNYSSWDNTSYVTSLGSNYATNVYGQIFTAPNAATTMTSFENTLVGVGEGQFDLNFYVAAWDGVDQHATGPILFEQDNVVTPGGYNYQNYTYNFSAPVTGGQQYVAFLSNLGVANTVSSSVGEAFLWQPNVSDHYSQWSNYSASRVGDLFTNSWDGGFLQGEFVYNATFSGVTPASVTSTSSAPSPAAILPFALGLLARRKRKA